MRWTKDPNSSLSYTWDWTTYLNGDTLSTVTWIVPAGLTNAATSNTSTTATIKLSGGTAGRVYEVTCRITTTGGLSDDRTAEVAVKHT